jgi:WD40 repeat protein
LGVTFDGVSSPGVGAQPPTSGTVHGGGADGVVWPEKDDNVTGQTASSGATSPAAGILPFVFQVDPSMSTRKRMATTSHTAKNISPSYFSTGVIGGKDVAFSAGHWDGSFKCAFVTSGQLVQSMWRHRDVVTCLVVSKDSRTLVTGSRDTTVMVWDMFPTAASSSASAASAVAAANGSTSVASASSVAPASIIVSSGGVAPSSLVGGSSSALLAAYGATMQRSPATSYGMSSLPVSQFPRHVLFGHDKEVLCVAVNEELDVILSGSEDGSCMLHSLIKGRYIRSLYHPNRCSIDLASLSCHGDIVFYSKEDFYMFSYSINGQLLRAVDTSELITSIVISADGRYVLTAGHGRHVTLRRLHDLEVIARFPGKDKILTSLEISTDQRFIFAGTQDGSIIVYSINFTTLLQNSQVPALPVT